MTSPDEPDGRPTPTTTFCVLPFTHVASTIDGVWGRCCFDATNDYDYYYTLDSRPPMTLAPDALGCAPGSAYAADNPERTFSLREAFNSPNLRATRLAMLAGQEVSACRLCYERDHQGITSPRVDANNTYSSAQLDAFAAATDSDGAITDEPISLDLRLGNSCNLRCTMCSFPTSSAITESTGPWVRKTIDPYSGDPGFWDDILTLAPHLSRIYFAGGEPFLQPSHPRLLQALIETGAAGHIRLHYNSNLTTLRSSVLLQLTHFEHVTIAASCDGTGTVFESIRRGASWDVFVANLRHARQYVATIYLDCTVQTENVAHLDELITFAKVEGVGLRLENYVDCPDDLSVRNLSASEKATHTRRLEQLRADADTTGRQELAEHLTRLLAYLNSPPAAVTS